MRFILLLKTDEKAEAGPMPDEKILFIFRKSLPWRYDYASYHYLYTHARCGGALAAYQA
jgi:hypothetical protein